MRRIKISQLPVCTDFEGLYTLGTDENNRSVRIPFDFIKEASVRVENAAEQAVKAAEQAVEAAKRAIEAAGGVEQDAEGMTAEEGREIAERVFGKADLPEAEAMTADEGRTLAERIFS